ncbi:hypothetical protein BOX15_Mlig005228g6, partial [Macrostomum lignano]
LLEIALHLVQSSSLSFICNRMGPEAENFCAITGATSAVAAQYLAACNNNLEMALNMYMETGPPTPAASRLRPGTDGSSGDSGLAATPSDSSEEARAPMPQTVAQLTPNAGAIFAQHSGANGSGGAARPTVQPFADHRAAMLEEAGAASGSSGGRPGKRSLHDLYRPPSGLLHPGSLESAMRQARLAGKWLLVDLQDVGEFSCQLLNRDLWSEPAVQSVLEASCVFLQLDSRSPVGCRFAVNYRAPGGCPFVALLDPVTGEQRLRFAPGQLRHLDSFLDRLTEFLAQFERPECLPESDSEAAAAIDEAAAGPAAPAAKRARSKSPELRQSVDQPELGANGVGARRPDCDNGEEAEAEQLRRAVAASRLVDGQDHRLWLGDPDEPQRCRLLIRYPDGRRNSLDWPASSRLKALTVLLDSEGFPAEDFELLATHPRRLLSQLQPMASLAELGLCPTDTVYVQAK